MKKTLIKLVPFLAIFILIAFLFINNQKTVPADRVSIDYLLSHSHPGGEVVIEKTIDNKENYQRFVATYPSEGLSIKALLAIPTTNPPKNGFPVIVIAHGDVPTKTYDRSKKYVDHIDEFTTNGYIVFMPDYRGYADSEGTATNAYAFPDYPIDILNAISSIKNYDNVNPERIGMWSHSSGGHVALRVMVVNDSIKAGVFWGGAIGSYQELLKLWPTYWEYTKQTPPKSDPSNPVKDWRAYLVERYGPEENAGWDKISATSYLHSLNGPVQLHHAQSDEWVPAILSKLLHEKLVKENVKSELFIYENDDHNFEKSYQLAMERTLKFFNTYLK